MTKQELRELLGGEYPKNDYYERRLFDRLSIFPKAIDEWFHGLHNPGDVINSQSIKAILEKFRDELIGGYDII